ncbi:hypothetical protein [Synechococcus sp. C9]|uniref:hypothetical protein n=1 Tax=Synechococcus sp. C9 TaxID=102119 RepID=UPI0030DD3EBB
MELMMEDLMEEVIQRGGSDLHLSAGLPPYIRISGKLTPTDHEPMTPEPVVLNVNERVEKGD